MKYRNQQEDKPMSKNLLQAMKERRSHYGIGKELPVSKDQVEEVVKEAVTYVPSSFNSQSARAVVLFGGEHDKLWDITMESLRKIVPADSFAQTEEKILSFKAGAGTVLYFEAVSVVEGLQQQFPLYKDNFPVWAQQSNGMLQFAVWTLLDELNVGASLQHYNPLIDEEVAKTWNISKDWKLVAQMPFGNKTATVSEKAFAPIDERVKIFG